MGVWERSWAIARVSFGLIGKDKEMLWFPVLAGLFSAMFSLALLFPTIIIHLLHAGTGAHFVFGPLQWIATFASYFGLAFIATFFNVCLVNTVRVRLEGGDATFMDSIQFAFARVHLIVAWSLVSATVGILLHMIDSAAQKLGPIGKILLSILRSFLASAWSITTIFVIPVMVYREVGPFDAIRESVETLKKAWGESLVRAFGLGFLSFLCCFGCVLVIVAGGFACNVSVALGVTLIGVGILALLATFLLFNVANTVFNTVLYHWATRGEAIPGVEPEILSGVFRPRAA
jgi:uncharacterized protein DUF6159